MIVCRGGETGDWHAVGEHVASTTPAGRIRPHQSDVSEAGVAAHHDIPGTGRRRDGARFVVAADIGTAIVIAGGGGGAVLDIEVGIAAATADLEGEAGGARWYDEGVI